jgi:hypothetical protein
MSNPNTTIHRRTALTRLAALPMLASTPFLASCAGPQVQNYAQEKPCLLYTSPSPRDH